MFRQTLCFFKLWRNLPGIVLVETVGRPVQKVLHCIARCHTEHEPHLLNQRERDAIGGEPQSIKVLRCQQIHETLNLLALFEKPDTAKLVREVAIALMEGRYVSIPCAGGGSVSSETDWDRRKKDEENENFRLRC